MLTLPVDADHGPAPITFTARTRNADAVPLG